MATKGDNHYYGILTTTSLKKAIPRASLSMTFLGKISDASGAGDAMKNFRSVNPDKDHHSHQAAIDSYHAEIEKRKGDLEEVMSIVGKKLVDWKGGHEQEWQKLEEVAKGHEEGLKAASKKRKLDQEKDQNERIQTVSHVVDQLIEAVRSGDEARIDVMKRVIINMV
jgi:hypothetical protein